MVARRLAVLSMSHQLITSARRRRRDLGIVRALGADRRWVSRVLHWQ
jgi:predicted lysophospholipase L1 biosynthesis ABC-type transport system permease subunit